MLVVVQKIVLDAILTKRKPKRKEVFLMKASEVGYQHNEVLSVYVDECGDRQVMPFDTFEQAVEFTNNIRSHGTAVIGVMTTLFYDRYVERIIDYEEE